MKIFFQPFFLFLGIFVFFCFFLLYTQSHCSSASQILSNSQALFDSEEQKIHSSFGDWEFFYNNQNDIFQNHSPRLEKSLSKDMDFSSNQEFVIHRIEVDGVVFFDYKKIFNIIVAYENKKLSLREMFTIVDKVTKLYKDDGYVTTYAFLPEQDITDGVLHVCVVEDRLDRVIVLGKNASFYKKRILKIIEKNLSNSRAVNKKSLMQSIFLLNQAPDRKVFFYLNKGRSLGHTDLIVRVEERKQTVLGFQLSAKGNRLFEKKRYLLYGNIPHFLGVSDLFMNWSFIFGKQIWGISFLEKYRLGLSRFQLGSSFHYSSLDHSNEQDDSLKFQGNSLTGRFWVETLLKKNIFGYFLNRLGIRVNQAYIEAPLKSTIKDDFSVFFTEFEYSNWWKKLFCQYVIKYERGSFDFFGLKTESHFFKSDLFSDSLFHKWSFLSKMLFQREPHLPLLIFKAKGQCSFQNLLSSEKLSITGTDAVRSFSDERFHCESGVFLSIQLEKEFIKKSKKERKSLVFEGKKKKIFLLESLKPSIFLDYGFGLLDKQSEKSIEHFSGAGFGIRSLFSESISLFSEVSVPFPKDQDSSESLRFYLSCNVKIF